VFFLLGFLIADYDVEPHAHGVSEPAQGLDIRYAAAQFDARQGRLADSRSLCYFLLGEVPAPADAAKLVAQSQVPACLLVLGVLDSVAGLREAPGLEGLPPAVPSRYAFLSKWWVIVLSCSAWQAFFARTAWSTSALWVPSRVFRKTVKRMMTRPPGSQKLSGQPGREDLHAPTSLRENAARELTGTAGSYAVICCGSAVVGDDRPDWNVYSQLGHRFPGVRSAAGFDRLPQLHNSVSAGQSRFARPAGFGPATRCLEGTSAECLEVARRCLTWF
jgi:hypothetical protein